MAKDNKLEKVFDIPKSENELLLERVVRAPRGKAIVEPRLSRQRYIGFRALINYRGIKGVKTRTVGEETFLWMER